MDTTPPRTVTVALPSPLLLAGLAVAALAAAALLLAGWLAGSAPAHAQDGDAEPPPRLVILARSDNPADALASGPVGGVLGAPVLLTPTNSLHAAAADALEAIDPDLVVLAGGTTALSESVAQAVEALGYPTRRAAGADRHETAALVSALLAEFSTGRPVLTGTPVTDQVIPGLNAELLQGQSPDDLVAALAARVAALEATLAGVTRAAVAGRDTLTFDGMNLQVVNGTGSTDGDPNGLGNVIIGYNAQRTPTAARTGSHYLVVGDQHAWTRFGGLLAGLRNTASGNRASVTGGSNNTASGDRASVSGGAGNTASGVEASVSGGAGNTASGSRASVSGGSGSTASGASASVSGGGNTASGTGASVSGGFGNTASGGFASVLGGSFNTVSTTNGCHPGC